MSVHLEKAFKFKYMTTAQEQLTLKVSIKSRAETSEK
jgi:hypothetical protein